MKVLHAIWSLELGGSEAMLIDIANRQVREATVALMVGNAVVDEGLLASLSRDVPVFRMARPPRSRNPWHLFEIGRQVRTYAPDVLHAHSATLISAVPFSRARKVLTVHDTALPMPASVSRYDLVVSISKAVQADLLARPTGIPSTVVYNGIDFAAIVPRTWDGPPRPFRLVQVSRLVTEKKGQDVLLQALQLVEKVLGAGSVLADFIGDGPDRVQLVGMAERLGLAGRCQFLGSMPRSEVYRHLPGYDLLVQPSRNEGFGLTVVEGIAAGLPVLCADIEGPREILGNIPHRYLFAPDRPDECARQILQIIENARRPGFGELMAANREALRRRFDIDATAAGYLREYERLVGIRPGEAQ